MLVRLLFKLKRLFAFVSISKVTEVEVGSRKSEVGSRKLEVRNQKSEVGSQKSHSSEKNDQLEDNRLSSNWSFFSEECDRLRGVFHNLKYPKPLVETTIKRFVERRVSIQEPCPPPDVPSETVRVVLPFKDQSSANYVKQQLNNLSSKLNVTVQLVFVSPKLEQQLQRHEIKPPIVNQQCIVYEFKCNRVMQGMWVIHVVTYTSA